MIRNIKNLLLLFLMTTLMAVPAQALDLGFAREDGGQAGAFLSYGAGARALGMGKTFTGVADDASAVYWNAAGLAQLRRKEVTALYASLYENTGYGFVGYAHPLGGKKGTIGFAAVDLVSKGFQLRDEYNMEMGEGGVSESAGIVSYARALIPGDTEPFLTAGASVKVVRQIVNAAGATGYGADAGLLCRPVHALTVGVNFQNVLAPRLKLHETADVYPLSITAGAGYRLFNNNLLVAVDVNKAERRDYRVRLGGEYRFLTSFAARAGIDDTELACGLGFTFRDYTIDYAFAFHDAWQGHNDLGASHRFGITIRFN